jgi:hypothetical protein
LPARSDETDSAGRISEKKAERALVASVAGALAP